MAMSQMWLVSPNITDITHTKQLFWAVKNSLVWYIGHLMQPQSRHWRTDLDPGYEHGTQEKFPSFGYWSWWLGCFQSCFSQFLTFSKQRQKINTYQKVMLIKTWIWNNSKYQTCKLKSECLIKDQQRVKSDPNF